MMPLVPGKHHLIASNGPPVLQGDEVVLNVSPQRFSDTRIQALYGHVQRINQQIRIMEQDEINE